MGDGSGAEDEGEPAYDRERTQRALDALRGGGEPHGVRAAIVASWRRSLDHGVDGETLEAPYDVRLVDRDSALVRAADPVLEQLRLDLASSRSCVALTDARGRILRRVTGDPRVDVLLDALLVAPGFDYSERWVGTNALGTALHDRELVVVHEREHFHDRLARGCATATPVRDPLTGRVLGALGIAAPARQGDAAWSALARQSGLLVEDRLFNLHSDGQRELYRRYLAARRDDRTEVFAVGPEVLRAPPGVRQKLAELRHDDLWARAVDALANRGEAQVPLELSDGTTVPVRLRALEYGGRLIGAVGQLRPPDRRSVARVAGAALPVREYAGWSLPVRTAAVALRRLAEERRPVCVVGEPGTGKATMVGLVAGHVLPGQPLVTLDAAADSRCSAQVTVHLDAGSPVLVRHAEALSPEQLDELVAQPPGVDRPGWLALTWRSDRAPFGLALREPSLRVLELPPLRSRPDDIGKAVERLLRVDPGGRQATFTPALLERLRREPWPTNLAGLAELVSELLACRSGSVVDVDAFDEVFRATVRRRLSPVEWLLRAAIVDALRTHEGNKEQAAASLGMSRASIYRKIKSLDIDVPSLVGD